MARTSREWETGGRKRTVTCSFCGCEHRRRSRELVECRERARKGLPPVKPTEDVSAQATKRPGDETTRYTNDPLKGDALGHAIAKQLRGGKSPRKVAKTLNLPLARVEDVRKRLSNG